MHQITLAMVAIEPKQLGHRVVFQYSLSSFEIFQIVNSY